MRSFLLFVSLLYLSFLQANTLDFDIEAEQQLYHALHSPAFFNSTIVCSFQGKPYPIQVIHNPDREILWGGEFETPLMFSVIMIADLPAPLIRHLKESISEVQSDEDDYYIDLKGYTYFEDFKKIAPILICDKIKDPHFDAQIKECFASNTFVNKVFYYFIEGEYYRVRIIHNPNGDSFSASKNLALNYGQSERTFTITWKDRYGIILDKPAPSALIDHISSLVDASYWNWYFNFKIHNGTCAEFKEHSYNYITTYTLDTWFNFTENLRRQ